MSSKGLSRYNCQIFGLLSHSFGAVSHLGVAVEEPVKIERRPPCQSDLCPKVESQWAFVHEEVFSQFPVSLFGVLRHLPFPSLQVPTFLDFLTKCFTTNYTMDLQVSSLAACCLTARPILALCYGSTSFEGTNFCIHQGNASEGSKDCHRIREFQN